MARATAATLFLFLLLAAAPEAVPAAGPVAVVPEDVAAYLPEGADLDPEIPPPSSVLGFEVGAWHARPEQITEYFRLLGERSPRMVFEIQGRTHEGRPQPLLVVSSPANLERREEIRRLHLAATDQPGEEDEEEGPVVVWLAYSIHGNEASGANAALVVAYYLAASRDPDISELLDRAIVLLDPMQNPDGLGRFAAWVDAHRGMEPVADVQSREHQEVWPGGRGNHYWFDLNRDWLFQVHPESRHRVATFQRWRPHVVGDFHEMGGDATYFFQPGVPSRTNPLTPDRNQELTGRLARYHAEAFDRSGRLYYHGETYDDFYYGKGSTYPDVQGSIGVLFEQASVRGHRRDTAFGAREFPFAVQNHVLSSLSTLRGSVAMASDLRRYQREFFRDAREEATGSEIGGWVCTFEGRPERGRRLVEVLASHDVDVYRPRHDLTFAGLSRKPGSMAVVPARQRQFRLLRTLFERRSEYPDSTFYDVSTWTLPLAYDVPCEEIPARRWEADWTAEPWSPAAAESSSAADDGVVAFVLDVSSDAGPRALGDLLEREARAQVALSPLVFEVDGSSRRFPAGSVVLSVGSQPESLGDPLEVLPEIVNEAGASLVAVRGGFSVDGPDLGSPSLPPIEAPRPAILVGDGSSSYETGELWHLLDHEWGIEVSLIEREILSEGDLARYTHLFLVGGDYGGLDEPTIERLREWIRSGGVLVATREGARWAGEVLLAPGGEAAEAAAPEPENSPTAEGTGSASSSEAPKRLAYGDYERLRAEQEIAGAIFAVELDRTHPLAFGFPRDQVAVFRRGTWRMEPSENPFENVALYRDDPWLSGYVSDSRRRELGGSAAVVATRSGRGLVVRIADDPAFRGFWLGTRPFVADALFFGSVVERTSPPAEW